MEENTQETNETTPEVQQAGTAELNTAETKPSRVIPKLFTKKDERIGVDVYGYYHRETGMLEFVLPRQAPLGKATQLMEIKHTFIFSHVPYDRLNIYRAQSMKYNESDKSTSLDVIRLREFIWTFHLKDWNLEDENGNKVALKCDPDGTLSDESMDNLYSLPASLLDTAIALFEKRLNIV